MNRELELDLSLIISFSLYLLRFVTAFSLLNGIRSFLGFSGICAVATTLAFYATTLGVVSPIKELTMAGVLLGAVVEVIVGTVVAFPLLLLEEAVRQVAQIVDVSRGSQFAEQMLPSLQQRGSALTGIATIIGIAVAFNNDLPLYMIRALLFIKSSSVVTFALSEQSLRQAVEFLGSFVIASIATALPVFILIHAIDWAIGMFGRLTGRVSLLFELFSFRAISGLAAIVIVFNAESTALLQQKVFDVMRYLQNL